MAATLFPVVHVTVADDPWTLIPQWATLVLLAVAALIAFLQTRESRRLREEQIRPYVVVDLDISRAPIIYVAIENLGQTMATEVSFEVSPPLANLRGPKPTETNVPPLSKTWPTMPPRKRVEGLLNSAFELYSNPDYPMTYHVTANYRAPALGGREFSDNYILDLNSYRDLRFIPQSTVSDIVKSLNDVNRTLKSWTTHGGIGVITESRAAHERKLEAWATGAKERLDRQAQSLSEEQPAQQEHPPEEDQAPGEAGRTPLT